VYLRDKKLRELHLVDLQDWTASLQLERKTIDWRLRSTAATVLEASAVQLEQRATGANRAGNLERIFDPISCANRVRSSFAPVCQPEMTTEDHP
jgi:hypothetical protein